MLREAPLFVRLWVLDEEGAPSDGGEGSRARSRRELPPGPAAGWRVRPSCPGAGEAGSKDTSLLLALCPGTLEVQKMPVGADECQALALAWAWYHCPPGCAPALLHRRCSQTPAALALGRPFPFPCRSVFLCEMGVIAVPTP